MTSIFLEDVSVDFPIYSASSRSLKKTVIWMGTGGRIARDAKDRVVVQALRNLNLKISQGDRLGLIGHNGAGKTTLLRAIAGVYEPSGGNIHCDGHVTPLFDSTLGMDMEATGYENLYLRGLFLNIPPAEIRARTEEIAEFTELGDYLAMPMRTYSTGMVVRLALAISTCVDPEILLMDEMISAGDTRFLAKAEQRIQQFISRSSILILSSHSDSIIRQFCNKVILLEQGQIKAAGDVDEVLREFGGQM